MAVSANIVPMNRLTGGLLGGGIGLALIGFLTLFFLDTSETTWETFSLFPACIFLGIAVFNLGLILGLVTLYRGQAGQALRIALWLPISLAVIALLLIWLGSILLLPALP